MRLQAPATAELAERDSRVKGQAVERLARKHLLSKLGDSFVARREYAARARKLSLEIT